MGSSESRIETDQSEDLPELKKILFVFALLIAGAVFLLVWNNNSGGGMPFGLPSISLPFSGGGGGGDEGYTRITNTSEDGKFLNDRQIDFLEDIKFKDFQKAASYHSSEDRKKVNVSKLIGKMFMVKPELLDIMSYEILRIELDRSKTRARVHTKTKVKLLNTKEIREPELIFYWHKDPAEGWVMKLESSLR